MPLDETFSPVLELQVKAEGIFIPWNTVDVLAKTVRVEMFKAKYQPERILALGRGGMVPSRLLAQKDTPVHYIGCKSYEGVGRGSLIFYQTVDDAYYEMFNDPGTLIVDDLWDSGQTMQWAQQYLPKAMTAVLLSKEPNPGVHFSGATFPFSAWIVFPWE